MFFQELSELSKMGFSIELIKQIDIWFAFLPDFEKETITASKVSSKIGLDFTICETLLKKLKQMGLLEENYIIICPECEREIEIISKNEVLDKLESINYCYKCDKEIEITLSDIYISYKLIKGPTSSEEELRSYTKSLFDIKEDVENNLLDDSLEKLIAEEKEDVHDFFITPLKRKRKK